MTRTRIANAIFMQLCVNYEDAELREYYDEALAFYTRILENQKL